MREDLFQYIWKMGLFQHAGLLTCEGEEVSIQLSGDWNTDAGPDFSNARIRIGNTLWIGHVELHVKTSQWFEHRHHLDPAYKNVILHVVYKNDMADFHLPVLELQHAIASALLDKYRLMMETAAWIPCASSLPVTATPGLSAWIERMTIERMEDKSIRIKSRLMANTNDWEETAWQWIARSMGNPVNADPMEQVAQHTPLRIIRRLQGQSLKMEALLFGQAGFLTGPFRELYPNQLQTEYKHLCQQYQLEPIAVVNWKFGRMRPSHFPTLRLSQLAELLSTDPRIFSLILTGHYNTWMERLDIKAADYWMEHVHFKGASKKHGNQLGKSTKHSIMINAFIPLLVLYGRETDQEDYIQKALDLLEQIPKEDNKIVRNWEANGMDIQHAGHSQGFLHLHQAYCRHKRCLDCHIGYSILGKVKYI